MLDQGMWCYYLLSCAAAFRARQTQCWQVVLTRTDSGRQQPPRQNGAGEARLPFDSHFRGCQARELCI